MFLVNNSVDYVLHIKYLSEGSYCKRDSDTSNRLYKFKYVTKFKEHENNIRRGQYHSCINEWLFQPSLKDRGSMTSSNRLLDKKKVRQYCYQVIVYELMEFSLH
jgi:hypothetical protein